MALRLAILRFSLLETKYRFFFASLRMPFRITFLRNLCNRLSCDSPGRNSTFAIMNPPPLPFFSSITVIAQLLSFRTATGEDAIFAGVTREPACCTLLAMTTRRGTGTILVRPRGKKKARLVAMPTIVGFGANQARKED